MEVILLLEQKKEYILRKYWSLLRSFLSPFKCPENLKWSPYWNLIDRANGEGRKARSSSLDQCFLHLMYTQSPGDLAKMQTLMQWVWGGDWDSTHLTKLPGDASALDLNSSSKSPDYYSQKYNLLVQWDSHNQIAPIEENSTRPRLCCSGLSGLSGLVLVGPLGNGVCPKKRADKVIYSHR